MATTKLRITKGEDPKAPTPQQLAAANQFAKTFALRKGLISGESTHVGGAIPRFIDSATGQDITGVKPPIFPTGTIMDIRQVPTYVKDLQFDDKSNLPYFVNQETGDIQYVHPDIARSSRFNPNRGKSADQLIAKR